MSASGGWGAANRDGVCAPLDGVAPSPPAAVPSPLSMPGTWRWKNISDPYGGATLCLVVGRWTVGMILDDRMVPKGQTANLAVQPRLPGLKKMLGHYGTVEEAQACLIRAAKHWFSCLRDVQPAPEKDPQETGYGTL